MTEKRIAIILPVFNDGPSLVELITELEQALQGRSEHIMILVVDDGSLPSIDRRYSDRLASVFACSILTLKRNGGHQRAIAIGIAYAVENNLADIVLVMDADGEDRPAEILRLLAAIRDRDVAIAVGERTIRSEGAIFKLFYKLYQLMFLLLTGYRIGFGNFLALPALAARRVANMGELWLSLPATVLRSRVPIVSVPTQRGYRLEGKSHMNLVSLVVHGLRAMAVFTENVLTRIILSAAGLLLLCILASVIAVVQKVMGIATPGWVTSVVGLSLVMLLTTVILCFVSLAITISGAQAIAPPLMTFATQIDHVTKIEPMPRLPSVATTVAFQSE
jgi:hypothetical protein